MQHKINLRVTVLILALAAVAGIPGTARAVGLGKIHSKTRIGQPFEARIPITGISADNLQGLQVELGSQKDYQHAGISEPDYLFSLKFDVKQEPSGPYILVTSPKPIKLPFLNLIVRVSWPSGEVTRQYTVLLNPPVFAAGSGSGGQHISAPTHASTSVASQPVEQQKTPPAQPVESKPSTPAQPTPHPQPVKSPASQPEQQQPQATQQPQQQSAAQQQPVQQAGTVATPQSTQPSPPNRYKVQHGDTLWGISRQMHAANGVSVNQMMVAIYRSNPHAFRGNINRLQAGRVLTMPSRSQIAQVTAEEATRMVARQNSEWHAAKSSPQVASTGHQGQTGSGQAGTTTAAGAGSVASAEQQAGSQAGQQATAPATQGHVVLTTPTVTTAGTVAATPGSASAGATAGAAAAGGKAVASATTATAAEGSRVAGAAAPATPASAGGPMKVQNNAMAGMAAATASHAASKQAPAKQAQAPTAGNNAHSVNTGGNGQASASGLMYWLQRPTGWIIIGAIVLILLALLLLLMRRRTNAGGGGRAKGADDAARGRGDGHDAGPEPSGDIEEGIPHEAETDAGSAEKQAEAGREDEDLGIRTYIGGPSLDVNKVDPVEEADLHLGFGDYGKAAEVLREAMSGEPERAELRRKLLDVYFAAGDGEAFASEAATYRKDADAGDWEEVAVMGRQLRPNDDLFAEAPQRAAPRESGGGELDLGGAGDPGEASDFLDINLDKLSVDAEGDQSDFERTMDELSTFIETYVPASSEPPVALQLPPEEREENSGGKASGEETSGGDGEEDTTADPGDAPLEFTLDDEDLPSPRAASTTDAESGEAEEAGEPEDLVDTKLDLARAYIDMGDGDSARSVLEEVIDEGDEHQSSEARQLMEGLD